MDNGMVSNLHQKVLWSTIKSVTKNKSASLIIKRVESWKKQQSMAQVHLMFFLS